MKEDLAVINPQLHRYLEDNSNIFNSIEFSKLKLQEKEEFLDPITRKVMNLPVVLHNKTFDFYTLALLDVNSDGSRADPFNRILFTSTEIVPNTEMLSQIRAVINAARKLHKSIIRQICLAAQNGNLDELKSLINNNPHINVNEDFADGYTALHYACKHENLDCAKYLLEKGSELDLPAGKSKVTPFMLLSRKCHSMAEELKQYLLTLLQNGILANDALCCLAQAKLLLNNNLVTKNGDEAINLLNKAGDLGAMNGYLLCADIYRNGLYGVKVDIFLAEQLYYKAIQKFDDIIPKIKLATLLLMTRRSVVSAEIGLKIKNLTDSVDNFDPEALFLYSLLHKHGKAGICISQEKSIIYLKLAANGGLVIAQCIYAVQLISGEDVVQNHVQAAHYFKLAAAQNYAEAQYNLGICYHKGYGVEKNPKEAAKYFKLAADNGHGTAKLNYAICCENGYGVDRDLIEAEKYYQLAVEKNVPGALERLNELSSTSTKNSVKRSRRLGAD